MIHDLKTLILAFHPVISIETVEEQRVTRLVRSVGRELRIPVLEWSSTTGLVHAGTGNEVADTTQPVELLSYLSESQIDAIYLLKDFAAYLETPALQRPFRDAAQRFARRVSSLILTGPSVTLPVDLEHKAVRFELQLPSRDELDAAIKPVIQTLCQRQGVQLDLSSEQYAELLKVLAGMTLNQARQAVAYAGLIDGRLDATDLPRLIDRKAETIRDGGPLEFFPALDNRFELGGFGRLKEWLARAKVGFSEEARRINLSPPRGALIVGVQGCGKSLAAKFIAREWQLPLLKLDSGRLFDKYIGESEKNFNKAIAIAESMAPAVLWVDEIEKAMAPTGGSEGDGGVSRRMFGSFLTWLQEKDKPVFVVATANDLSQTPPELLRKGRFDEIFFVDIPDAASRAGIFRIHLELRKQRADDFDLDLLAQATEGFSGAEIEQAVVGGLYRALHQGHSLDAGYLLREIQETVPLSVTRREDFEHLRATARGRFVNAN
ncbi:MAG: AAA family ATPase [Acidobacteriota bacterium]